MQVCLCAPFISSSFWTILGIITVCLKRIDLEFSSGIHNLPLVFFLCQVLLTWIFNLSLLGLVDVIISSIATSVVSNLSLIILYLFILFKLGEVQRLHRDWLIILHICAHYCFSCCLGCCYSMLLKNSHPCVEGAMHHDCPVCCEVIHYNFPVAEQKIN